MKRAWALVYALVLIVAIGSICAINQPRAPLLRLAAPAELATPRTTLIPPVQTTPNSDAGR